MAQQQYQYMTLFGFQENAQLNALGAQGGNW
jgi:hypothetical protein